MQPTTLYACISITILLLTRTICVANTCSKPISLTDSIKHQLNKSAFINKRLKGRPDPLHRPSKAVFRSAVLPGWGQLYNRKSWKLPVVYGVLGVLGQQVIANQRSYKQYLTVYKYFRNPLDVSPDAAEYETYIRLQRSGNGMGYAEALQSNYQRNMQLSILGLVGFWGIQMIDAYIDAKMIQSYSINPDLSFNVSPGIISTTNSYAGLRSGVTPVIKATLSF